jgi:hypothetical protein
VFIPSRNSESTNRDLSCHDLSFQKTIQNETKTIIIKKQNKQLYDRMMVTIKVAHCVHFLEKKKKEATFLC